jgi:DNA-nicking Smr family endonuclease
MVDISDNDENGVIEVPIDGALDLHNFSPKDLKYLIPDYLEECRKKNILQVRIIHGKGIGNLRRTVHSILQKIPEVVSFRLAGKGGGSWGATLVILRKLQK